MASLIKIWEKEMSGSEKRIERKIKLEKDFIILTIRKIFTSTFKPFQGLYQHPVTGCTLPVGCTHGY